MLLDEDLRRLQRAARVRTATVSVEHRAVAQRLHPDPVHRPAVRRLAVAGRLLGVETASDRRHRVGRCQHHQQEERRRRRR